MMTEKQLFLVIAIICLVLFIVYKLFNKIEGFEIPTTAPTDAPTPQVTPDSSYLADICPTIAPKPWWELEAPKQIVSYITGVRFPVHAIKPADSINSPFQVPYIKSGETESSGCIVVENTGTFSTRMCNADSSEQRWKIKRVTDSETFNGLISAGSQYYSSNIGPNVNLPAGVQYGFFMVISEKDPSMVLASNGGSLTVQRIGNYTSQFWDITKDIGNANIAIYDVPPETGLSLNYTDPKNSGPSGAGGSAGLMYQYPGLSGSTNGTSTSTLTSRTGTSSSSSSSSSSSRTTTGSNGPNPFNINVNFDSESLMKLFGDMSTTGAGINAGDFTTSTTSTTSAPEGFNPDTKGVGASCPACPSILTDYIAKNNIPCLGCKL